jgi:transketolase
MNYLYQEAKKNKNIILLIGDLGYSVVEEFQKNLPDQFINIGIAEQNMAGIAAGLALTGKKVFCYSIIPFLIMRAYEQIRVDVCCQNLDVTFIGVAGWFAYGSLGNTHYGIEDINVMKWLPNMKIIAPADKYEAQVGMDYVFSHTWPFFVRLNRWWEPDIYKESLSLASLEWWIETKSWSDVCLMSTGNILWTVLKTAEILEKSGISTQVISLPLIKPMDPKAILTYIQWKKWVFTIEEHTIIWWLGDSIASILAENSMNTKFKKFGIPDIFPSLVGNQDYMRKLVGLDEETLSKNILDILS